MALPQGAKTRKKTAQNQFEQRWFYLENLLLERRQMFTELSGIICNNFTARKSGFRLSHAAKCSSHVEFHL